MYYVVCCSYSLLLSSANVRKNISSNQGVKFPLNRHIFDFCKGAVSGAQRFAAEGSTP